VRLPRHPRGDHAGPFLQHLAPQFTVLCLDVDAPRDDRPGFQSDTFCTDSVTRFEGLSMEGDWRQSTRSRAFSSDANALGGSQFSMGMANVIKTVWKCRPAAGLLTGQRLASRTSDRSQLEVRMKRQSQSFERAMAPTGMTSLATGQDVAGDTAFLCKYDIVRQQQLVGCIASELSGRSATQGLRNTESRRHQACSHCHRSLHWPARPRRGTHYPVGSALQVAACG